MSLAFKFQLTTAQTHLLVTIANYHFSSVDGGDNPKYAVPVWSAAGGDYFVSIAKRLEAKGLISHDSHRSPTFQPTEEGLAVAALIVRQAQQLVDLTVGVEKRRKLYEAKQRSHR